MQTKLHPFEKAGLGKAPFWITDFDQAGTDSGRQGTTCDFCGTYIVNIFFIKSSDGKKFVVGSTCVEKTEDEELIKVVHEKLKAANRQRRNEKSHAEWLADAPRREVEARERQAEQAKRDTEHQARQDAKKEAERLHWLPFNRALAEGLRRKDFSKIRSQFKIDFITRIVEQFDTEGIIHNGQRRMLYGTGEWNGKYYDHGMLNDQDYVNIAIAKYHSGDPELMRQGVNEASFKSDKLRKQFEAETGVWPND